MQRLLRWYIPSVRRLVQYMMDHNMPEWLIKIAVNHWGMCIDAWHPEKRLFRKLAKLSKEYKKKYNVEEP